MSDVTFSSDPHDVVAVGAADSRGRSGLHDPKLQPWECLCCGREGTVGERLQFHRADRTVAWDGCMTCFGRAINYLPPLVDAANTVLRAYDELGLPEMYEQMEFLRKTIPPGMGHVSQ